jgi:Integrase core domain
MNCWKEYDESSKKSLHSALRFKRKECKNMETMSLDILSELAARNKLVPFLGAGTSHGHLSLDWNTIAQEMGNAIGGSSGSNIDIAEEFERAKGNSELCDLLRKKLIVKEYNEDLDRWAYWNKVELDFSRPGTPSDNAFIEAFNSRFRQECLNEHWFLSLDDARQKIEAWRLQYNSERPHSALNYQTPEEFINQIERQRSVSA